MEFLKEYLSEETYSKVSEELTGKDLKLADLSKGEYVSKQKYNADLQTAETKSNDFESKLLTAQNDLKTAKTDLESAQAEIQSLKESAADTEKLKQDYESKLTDSEVKRVVDKSGAKDTDIVFGLLDRSKIKRTENGIDGVQEQLEHIKTDKSYLFGKNIGTGGSMGTPHNKSAVDDEKIREVMGLPKKG